MLQLVISRGRDQHMSEIDVVLGERKVSWYLTTFERARLKNKAEVFTTINGYLATLPSGVQEELFSLYETLQDDIVHSSAGVEVLIPYLTNNINRLVECLNLEGLAHYCKFHAQFFWPPTLKDEYGPNERPESTYLRKDYGGLLFLATALKAFLPIWGELIKRIQREVGANFKEQVCLKALGSSELFDRPEMDRIREYVQNMADNVKLPNTAIYNSLGTNQLGDYLLSVVLVRRLAVSETNEPTVNLISHVYNFIDGSSDKMDSKFSTRINDKNPPSAKEGSGEEDNYSIAEVYKIKQEIPDNYVVGYEVYLDDILIPATTLKPDIDQKLLETCLKKLMRDKNLEFFDWRLQIIGLLTAPIIPPRSLTLLSFDALLKLAAVTQTILLELGFVEIAHLLTATSVEPDVSTIHGNGTTGAHRARISKENLEQLHSIYQYYRVTQKAQLRGDIKNALPGVKWIEHVNRVTQDCDWKLNSPIRHKDPNYKNGQRYEIPSEFRNMLAELLITFKGKGEAHVASST